MDNGSSVHACIHSVFRFWYSDWCDKRGGNDMQGLSNNKLTDVLKLMSDISPMRANGNFELNI